MTDLFSFLDSINAKVFIQRGNKSYDQPRCWHVSLEIEQEGTKLEVIENTASLEEGLSRAVARLRAVAGHGLPALMAPVVEAKPSDDIF